MDKPQESIELKYVDAKDCRTVIATGAVLSKTIQESELFQLSFFVDVNSLNPETLKLHQNDGNSAVYARTGNVTSMPYREVAARVLLTRKTIAALIDLLQRLDKKPETEAISDASS